MNIKANKYKKQITFIIIAIVTFITLYATYFERHLIINKNISVPLEATGQDVLRIVQFSDTHLGKYFSLEQFKKVVEKINEQSPDLVVFTGDLFDVMSEYENPDAVIKALSKIEAKIGKIAIMGNRDFQKGEEYFVLSMNQAGFKVLRNESIKFSYKDHNIMVYGVNNWDIGLEQKELLDGIDSNNINLLLMHEPDVMNKFEKYPIDIAFAGHSHGGQVYLPFIGPIIKTNMCEDYLKGSYRLNNEKNTLFYVSSGIGNTKVPFRFFNIPEIILFDVTM
ncbi:metallophosphoesterase [Niameybacter massiliensis]|uniref:Metallophosphoesterase n=1 Tax=Holtiella tumoricola TaxID=3018743 RepID=A0AA42DL15_9FIRM|nr:metallophosphoesterase [Holtiella tumoricola]MDA3731016.1 metallophosphoesterase [Holtiella tumoricola]